MYSILRYFVASIVVCILDTCLILSMYVYCGTERSRSRPEPVVGEVRGHEVQEASHTFDLRSAVVAFQRLRADLRCCLETAHQTTRGGHVATELAPVRSGICGSRRPPRTTTLHLEAGKRRLKLFVVLASVTKAVSAPLAIHCRHTRAVTYINVYYILPNRL